MSEKHIPKFVLLERDQQKHFLEALIFSSNNKLSLKIILNILSEKDDFFEKYSENNSTIPSETEDQYASELEKEFDEMMLSKYAFNGKYVSQLIDEINTDLEVTNRPFRIVDFAGGYEYSTLNEYGELVASVIKAKSKKRISNVQLETLAIIAYKQPVTKPEIEQIRGVNSKEAISALVDKGFVTVVGRSEKVGKPLLYGSTALFLETFGLGNLKNLPNLKEIDELTSGSITQDELNQVVVNPTTLQKDIETSNNQKPDVEIDESNETLKATENTEEETSIQTLE